MPYFKNHCSLRKSRKIFHQGYKLYLNKGRTLPQEDFQRLENLLESLDQQLKQKNEKEASDIAQRLEEFSKNKFKKSSFTYVWELAVAIVLALMIAIVIRQMWFEPYQIPTGSMRPTFREQDHLTVTKTAFGINVPLIPQHLYFDPELVQRGSVITFSGHNINLTDTDTTLFGIIPYKKRYIKRLIGKPGDTLYFYGGKIYGIDKDDNRLLELLDSPSMQKREYIPFLTFEGETSKPKRNMYLLSHFNQTIGRLTASNTKEVGEVFNGTKWVKDKPKLAKEPHDHIGTYSDFWGFRNYAMARLLNHEQLQQYPKELIQDLPEASLYLELRHTPSLTYPKPLVHLEYPFEVVLNPFIAIIPLQQKHLEEIMKSMYTARFVVQNGYATRYTEGQSRNSMGAVPFSEMPDGTYEFYDGKATKIGWGGNSSQVPATSPLYDTSAENVKKLFNLGIEFHTAYEAWPANQFFLPHRYAYFRDGDLYLLGSPIIKKDDPILSEFHDHEKRRQESSSKLYVAFKDWGPPLQNGEFDLEFIKTFGIKVPDKHYMVLGDNHAMSADSRVFGFVPEKNIRGAPVLIVWPFGERWGFPDQRPYPFITIPRLIIWASVILLILIYFGWREYRYRTFQFKKIER